MPEKPLYILASIADDVPMIAEKGEEVTRMLDMIELLAHAAEAAEAMRERDRELLAEAGMIEEVA